MYITAITQNLSKKCCMQYLSPLFNYTGYKNKTSILHPSGSLPTEGTLNPSSDPLSLAHPSPVFPHWLGWRTEPLEHGIPWGSRSQQWDLNPEEPSLPPSCCRALWGRAGQKDPGLLEWLGAGGWCLQPRGLSLAQLGWVWLKTPSQPGWEQLLAPLQDDSRAQDAEPEVLGLEQLWQREHRCHTSVFGHVGPGSPNWSPRVCQVLDSATGPQALCSLGCAAQHPSVLHLRFLESRNKETNICLRGREHVQLQFWGF